MALGVIGSDRLIVKRMRILGRDRLEPDVDHWKRVRLDCMASLPRGDYTMTGDSGQRKTRSTQGQPEGGSLVGPCPLPLHRAL